MSQRKRVLKVCSFGRLFGFQGFFLKSCSLVAHCLKFRCVGVGQDSGTRVSRDSLGGKEIDNMKGAR